METTPHAIFTASRSLPCIPSNAVLAIAKANARPKPSACFLETVKRLYSFVIPVATYRVPS